MDFKEVLESEYRCLVEIIEYYSDSKEESNIEYVKQLKKELLDKSGYVWID